MWKNLTEEQKNALIAINDEMLIKAADDGIARYKKLSDYVALTRPERKVISSAIHNLEVSIEKMQQRLLTGAAMPGRPQAWMPAFLAMSADKLAFATLACLITGSHGEPRVLSTVATRLANDIMLTMQLEEINKKNRQNKETRGFARAIKGRLATDPKTIKKVYNRLSTQPLKWSISSKLGLGTNLINLAIQNTGLFNSKLLRDGKKTTYYVMLEEGVADLISSMEEEIAISRPQRMHMCCPPIPWRLEGNSVVGGYRNMQTEFIRVGFNGNGRHGNDLRASDLTAVLSAVNAIQDVEWCIDHDSLEFLEQVISSNNPIYDNICPASLSRPHIGRTKEMTKKNLKSTDRRLTKNNQSIVRQHQEEFQL